MAQISHTRQQLLDTLRGQTIHIPDLDPLWNHWPQAVSPHLDALQAIVDEQLDAAFPEGKRLQQMKETKLPLLTATWWPYGRLDRLATAARLLIWLHMWDDELDSAEYSSLINDLPAAIQYRNDTLDFIGACLTGQKHTSQITDNKVIKSFKPIGDAVYKLCTPAQSAAFLAELTDYITTTQTEQESQLADNLPTITAYIQRRLGSGAVKVCYALTEFCYGISVSPSIINDPDMRIIYDETAILSSITNDLLSMKKEIHQNQVDTTVPILYLECGSLAGAVGKAVELLREGVRRTDEAALVLKGRYKGHPEAGNMRRIVEACKVSVTGNLFWEIRSGRFGICREDMRGGVRIVL